MLRPPTDKLQRTSRIFVASPAHKFAKETTWVASTSVKTANEDPSDSPIKPGFLNKISLEQANIHAPSPTVNSDEGKDT